MRLDIIHKLLALAADPELIPVIKCILRQVLKSNQNPSNGSLNYIPIANNPLISSSNSPRRYFRQRLEQLLRLKTVKNLVFIDHVPVLDPFLQG